MHEIAQHPAAREREVEMQLVHPAHDGEIGRGHGSRQVIDAAPADVQSLRLAGDGQLVRPVDHRLALSRPALLSAPSKKSFVRVSSPILAWRVLTSTGGGAPGSVLASAPNTPAAPSKSSAFQAVIWFACTSNCCASSASVFSPLMAANATFALKAGLCARRVRFVMLAPDPRHYRRFQADPPLIALSEFGQPPLFASALQQRGIDAMQLVHGGIATMVVIQALLIAQPQGVVPLS